MTDKNYNSETKTNSYRSWSDVLAGTETHSATLYDKSTGAEIARGSGCTSEGAQRGLEGKLSKK